MDVVYERKRVEELLRAWLRRGGVSLSEASERLGRHRDYLSQVLGGRVKLREAGVLEVLAILGNGPRRFYGELYRLDPAGREASRPLSPEEARAYIRELLHKDLGASRGKGGRSGSERHAGRKAPGVRRPGSRPAGEGGAANSTAGEEPLWEEPVATAAEREALVARERELLAEKLRAAGFSQRRASLELGRGGDYLNQVLQGRVTLKTEHVMAVLEVIGLAPAVFYAQLYAFPHPEERDEKLTGGVSLAQVQDLIADALLELEEREAAEAEDEEPDGDGDGDGDDDTGDEGDGGADS